MSVINVFKGIYYFLPKNLFLVLYLANALHVLDCGDVVHVNCFNADTNPVESVHTAAAKLILCGTSHGNMLNDLGLTPLHIRRQFHIVITFRNTFLISCSSFLSGFAHKLFKNISNSSPRFPLSAQPPPSCKTQT